MSRIRNVLVMTAAITLLFLLLQLNNSPQNFQAQNSQTIQDVQTSLHLANSKIEDLEQAFRTNQDGFDVRIAQNSQMIENLQRVESPPEETSTDKKTAAQPPPVWKTSAHACTTKPVHLEKSWYMSQSSEDKELQNWFKDICQGTYLEIGGLDGIRWSNTYLYNKGLNWTGVLVEASPLHYLNLIKNRPNEIATVHAGVCQKKMDLHWVETVEAGRPAVGGFQEFAAPAFQKKWWSEEQIKNAKIVQCQTLEQILLDAVGPKFFFDFFSLDVEGAEYAVLQSINFDLVGFGVILVEADERNGMKDTAARNLLESNGYTYLEKKHRSSWFVHKDFWAIYKDLIYA